MWGSLIVSKVAGRTRTRLFLWDSLKYITWNKWTNFLRRTKSWWKPVDEWSCVCPTFHSCKNWSRSFFPCKNNEDKQEQNLSKSGNMLLWEYSLIWIVIPIHFENKKDKLFYEHIYFIITFDFQTAQILVTTINIKKSFFCHSFSFR